MGANYRILPDGAAASLIASGAVDAVITGADRVAANGDSANKIGTSLKALAAQDAGVPFYIAAPFSTLDFACPAGSAIPIEDRDADELLCVSGVDGDGHLKQLRQAPADTAVRNPAFDVTPARLIRGIVTERGVAAPGALRELYPAEDLPA